MTHIGGEEGFLKYYQKNIQSIIGSPYRTNLDVVFEYRLTCHPKITRALKFIKR